MENKELSQDDKLKLYSFIVTKLSSGNHAVKFKKVNGDIRSLNCTREYDVLVEKLKTQDKQDFNKTKPLNLDVISVFDLDSDSWKAFKLNSLIEIDGININTLIKHAQIGE